MEKYFEMWPWYGSAEEGRTRRSLRPAELRAAHWNAVRGLEDVVLGYWEEIG